MTTDYKRFPILYVDDDRANLLSLCYALEDEFSVVTASSGEEALRRLVDQDFAILLSDQRMPGMTGVEVCARARQLKPQVVRLIITAYSDLKAATDAINLGQVSRYITKPWNEAELRGILRTALDVFALQRLVSEMELKLLQGERTGAALAVTAELDHDLRQMLAAVKAGLDYVQELSGKVQAPEVAAEFRSVAADGQQAIGHALDLLRRVREGAVARLGEPVEADAARVIELAVQMVRLEIGKKARIEVLAEGRPHVRIVPTELAQVLLNLMSNAFHALPEGEAHKQRIVLHLRCEGAQAVLTVKDTGPGIPPEIVSRIFQAYFTARPEGAGTGLGLAIVKQILDRCGGEIHVESVPGSGTTFTLRLPLLPA